ncbi:MAG: methionine--tRNA ligase [Armatimonadetes bacterium]|nr:methionine--tRNA ligase [Armatimonadota bacterium]MDW8122568.1 methionine--tRNA ligase [Armatimonadota bacterium]
MGKKIFIGVAWPYANGRLHLGHLAGAYLPADILARYHRMKGNSIIMVSGSDSHGTPIALQAEKEGVSPKELFHRYHRLFLSVWDQFAISFDLYTHTDTENHHQVSQQMFCRLRKKGFVVPGEQEQMYSPTAQRFLPDRYVVGTCPRCGYERARGDQCEQCGALLEPTQLINPRSLVDGSVPVVRKTLHYFLDLPAFQDRLKEFVRSRESVWRTNVYRFTLNYIEQGLQPRPITRDLDWGIPVPEEGFQGKVLYVWFEAVIGYLSATLEWSHHVAPSPSQWKDLWQSYWYDPSVLSYYFIGKDNIPFHTLIWPALLMGAEVLYEGDSGTFVLPYDVPANEFLNLEGDKFSTSRNWAVWADEVAERYEPDAFRYYLTAIAPETGDTEFTWFDFVRKNNDELVGQWGNLVHRVLSFTQNNFEGQVPDPGLTAASLESFLSERAVFLTEVAQLIESCRFRRALSEIQDQVRILNRFWDEQQPWHLIRSDRQKASAVVYAALCWIDTLKLAFSPILPRTSERLHQMLGNSGGLLGSVRRHDYEDRQGRHTVLLYEPPRDLVPWEVKDLPVGQRLGKIAPLFAKLDHSLVGQERSRLGLPPL